jgi:hypothetical protein
MPNPEHPAEHPRGHNEPYQPSPLPPELIDFLKERPFAALLHGSDQGTIVVLKAPLAEIRSAVGRVPIQIRYDLHEHPKAPVVRTSLRIYDDPKRPLAFECFTNIADEQQHRDFAQLAKQPELLLLFYDEQVQHRLSKRVRNVGIAIPVILRKAQQLLAKIPTGHYDFDRAKADVMTTTHL